MIILTSRCRRSLHHPRNNQKMMALWSIDTRIEVVQHAPASATDCQDNAVKPLAHLWVVGNTFPRSARRIFIFVGKTGSRVPPQPERS